MGGPNINGGTLQQRSGYADAYRLPRSVSAAEVPTELTTIVREMALLAQGAIREATPLASSRTARVYRVDLGWAAILFKQALALDHGATDSLARERTAAESAWFKFACSVAPGAAPVVLGAHAPRGALAVDYLDPIEFPTWRSQLAAHRVEPTIGSEIGDILGRLHAASAHESILQERFASQTAFRALALEPAFQRALQLPNSSARLAQLTEHLATNRIALVHGAMTPDNVLVGPCGPIVIDADCAHYGDPMFDVATCLAGLAAQMAAPGARRDALRETFEAFRLSYFAHVIWELPEHAEARAAALIPALIPAALAAEHGVAWFSEAMRAAVQRMLTDAPSRLGELAQGWIEALGAA